MKAVAYDRPMPSAASESLLDIELPAPAPGARDLLVQVRAVSVNPVDTKLRSRVAPEPGTRRVLGFDAAGVVGAVGSEVTLFRAGDEVYYAGSIARPGSNAEYQLVDERIVGRRPTSLSFAQSAAMPLTSITAWELLFDRLGLFPGSDAQGNLLIVGGAGGVGSLLIQLARRLTALTVIATASRPDSRAWCESLGAHHVIDHRAGLAVGLATCGVSSVQYVACLTATDQHWPAICELVAPQGKIAIIDDPGQLDIVPLKRKSVSVHWELMFTRSLFETRDMIEQHRLLNEVARLVDEGVLRSTLRATGGFINAENLRAAHRQLESGTSIGKLVLEGF